MKSTIYNYLPPPYIATASISYQDPAQGVYPQSHHTIQEKMDGETCVLDVRTVNVRRQKRKLILADRGDGPVVYKLENSPSWRKIIKLVSSNIL